MKFKKKIILLSKENLGFEPPNVDVISEPITKSISRHKFNRVLCNFTDAITKKMSTTLFQEQLNKTRTVIRNLMNFQNLFNEQKNGNKMYNKKTNKRKSALFGFHIKANITNSDINCPAAF